MYKLLYFSLVIILVNYDGVKAKIAPDYIKLCPGLMPDCLKKNIQEIIPLFAKGLPSLGVDSIDPLKKDHVSLNLPGGFKVEFFDGVVTGLRKCIIDDVKFDTGFADFKFHCNATLKGKYKANGRILIVSINGDGDAKIKISNVQITARVHFRDMDRDGIAYREITKYNAKYEVADRITFNLTNLFKENPELSETVLTFLNENWKQLNDEFGKPIFDEILVLVFEAIKKFFLVIPKNELIVE